jgi:hypothetical protein
MKRALLCLALILPSFAHATDAVWQWSVATPRGRAFLWIPETCQHVRAVLVGQHNMSEEGLFENASFRSELSALGIAEVWIAPPTEMVFDFNNGAGERFEAMLRALAEESGYSEVAEAPVIPIGHSACASYPWNFAAWNPARTLAIISLHGDAPLTNMTGSGKPNPAWGDRTIDGIPALMMMAEYEWLEGRLAPALAFRRAHPGAPIAMLAEPGTGHFDVSEDALQFIAMFIRKAAQYRLPGDTKFGQPPTLRTVRPEDGWLVQRWHLNERRSIPAAPYAQYTGDRGEAFWAFDEEMAQANQHFREHQIGRKPQLLGFLQDGKQVPQENTHNQVSLRFEPEADGMTFHVRPAFLDTVDGGSTNTSRWTGLPAGTPIGHAAEGGPITVSRVAGPMEQVGPDTFRVHLNRTTLTDDRRIRDLWFVAQHEGDSVFKSARQQALMKLPLYTEGAEQQIDFAPIAKQSLGTPSLTLVAKSNAGAPVHFYVREGPAMIDGNTLRFTAVPPRARLPITVTVVAWQFGRATEPKLKAAAPVVQTFELGK